MVDRDEFMRLELRRVLQAELADGMERWRLQTNAGELDARFHAAGETDAAVIWVGGAGGGLDGPARGLYPRLAERLAQAGLAASLRLDYRHPNDLDNCVLDTMLAAAFLESEGYNRLVLVGHSFGGAVAISAGAESEAVVGVAALSSQTYGTDLVSELSPKPLLLLHGGADTVLPDSCSRSLYRSAGEPKHVVIYPGCGHGLDECREQVDRDLLNWLRQVLGPGQPH